MKFLRILKHYMKGIRLSALVLTIMMTWAMLSGVIAIAKLQNIRSDVRALSGADSENLYILNNFSSMKSLMLGDDRDMAKDTEAALEAHAAIEQVFTVRVVNPVIYNGSAISIVLYEPEMLEALPGLKKLGIDFSDQPNGCILGSKTFSGLDIGDTIQLNFSKQVMDPKSASFPVAGHLNSPYRRLGLSVSATTLYAADLFEDGDTILMQSTDRVMEQLESVAKRIEYDRNLIVQFKSGISDAEKEQVLTEIAPDYLRFSLDEVIGNAEAQISKTLKQELPFPTFLAISSLVAYLSLVILSFKKKEKDAAILALCGCSIRKQTALAFCAFQLFSLFPILINIAFVILWPKIQWMSSLALYTKLGISAETIMANPDFFGWMDQALFNLEHGITVDNSGFIVIALYYIITCAIALAAAIGAAKKKSPLNYLRGVTQ